MMSETPKLYTIRKLVWRRVYDDKENARYDVVTPFGHMYIEHEKPRKKWRWGYCFDEWYDEDNFDCDSLKDGKQKARAFWEDRLLPALTAWNTRTPDPRVIKLVEALNEIRSEADCCKKYAESEGLSAFPQSSVHIKCDMIISYVDDALKAMEQSDD